jgi:inner membrane protein
MNRISPVIFALDGEERPTLHLVTHALTGWLVANGVAIERRDRAIVTIAGFAPDFDGAGIVAELATRNTDHPLLWWSEYHHILGHNLAFGIAVAAVAAVSAKRRVTTALLAFAVFHLHLLGDLVGSRGPDGYDWPIPYFFPFLKDVELTWSGQWALNAWPNIAFTIGLLGATIYLAWRRGFSVLELVSARADREFVAMLRRRFGEPKKAESANARVQP